MSFPDPMAVYYGDLCLTEPPYLFAFDADFGAGEVVYEEMAGLFADGEMVTSDRTSNRELNVGVWIEAPTLAQISEPEAALMAETQKRLNTLTVYPGDGGEPFVFETFQAQPNHDRTEALEMAGMRLFPLSIPARPFVRAAELTYSPVMSAPAPPVAPVIVTVDDCNSTTGWESTPSPIATTGGYVYNSTPGTGAITLTRTGSFDTTATRYLVIEWARVAKDGSRVWAPPNIQAPAPLGDGRNAIATTFLDESWGQSTYDLDGLGVVGSFRVGAFDEGERRTVTLRVRNIMRTDKIPTGSPGHQLSRTINVEGSAPTTGTVHLWHDSTDIGDVLIHTSSTRNGMFSLEPFKIDHTSTPSVGTVSGSTKSLTSTLKYWVPASLFDPDRATGYLLLGRLSREGAGVITIEARSLASNGVTLVTAGRVHTYTVAPPTLPTQTVLTMAAMHMPTHRVGDRGVVELKITLADPVGTPVLDDLWLVDVQTGALTWIDADKSQRHLWQEEPTVTSPLPRVRSALTNDGSTSMDVDATSYMPHRRNPGEMYVYSVSTAAPSSQLQLEYFKRDPFHAGG